VHVFTYILQQYFVDWSPSLTWSMYWHFLPIDYSRCYVTVYPWFHINRRVRSCLWGPNWVGSLSQIYKNNETVRGLLKTQLDALISQIYFWNKTLHVSDSSFVHHQEFFTVHTAMLYVIQVLLTACKLYNIYHCWVYSEKLLMMDRGIVRNM